MSNPLVSVILPTFNRASVLERSIQSVLDQSYQSFELVVVDDASSDDTPRYLREMTHPSLRVLTLTANAGAAAARNRGIEIAKGELIAFQDSDDVWHPTKLEKQVTRMIDSTQGAGTCVCSVRYTKGGHTQDYVHDNEIVPGNKVIRRLLHGDSYATPSMVVRADLLRECGGFDERLPRRQDFELCLRLASKQPFAYVSEVLVENRASADSISGDPVKFARALEMIEETHASLFEADPSGRSFQTYYAAKNFAFGGERRTAASLAARAIRIDPSNWRAYLLWLGVTTRTHRLMKALKR